MNEYSDYIRSFSEQLESEKNRVRTLIDDNHWHSDGSHKEMILKKVLSQFIPETFKISSGFVIDVEKTGEAKCSNQIDILIYDSKSPTYYKSENLVIVGRKHVKAVIEVKTRLTSKTYEDAVKNIFSAQKVIGLNSVTKNKNMVKRNEVFYGIFAFDKSENGNCYGEYINENKKEDFISLIKANKKINKIISYKVCINGYSYSHLSIDRDKKIVEWRQSKNNMDALAFFLHSLLDKIDCKDIKLFKKAKPKNHEFEIIKIL